MKGDFTRNTYRPRRHYWGVLRQQGRVDLDADWNEQVRIAWGHQTRSTADLIGPAGGPQGEAGFELTVDGSGDVSIGAGRYYVAGIPCENETPGAFEDQPHADPTEALPTAQGLHLAYLDVWDRHVAAHADPAIRETALGGPDTATRAATAWQVRTALLDAAPDGLAAALADLDAARTAGDPDAEAAALLEIRRIAHGSLCDASFDPLGGSLESGTGTMAAQAAATPDSTADPCRFEPRGGYRRLENRLYRVEVHDGGPRADATFKWSRDNGSVAFSVEEFVSPTGTPATTTRVRVRRLGFDTVRSLRLHDWVEIVADDDERAGRPGTLVRITNEPDASERILELSDAVPVAELSEHPVVRRWDMPFEAGLMDLKTTWQELEDGIQVRFGAGTFHTGDYWVIPARTNSADIEWPPFPAYLGDEPAGAPEQLPPMGVQHYRAPLAVLVHDGTQLILAVDERRLYPRATGHTALFMVGGDGQEPDLPGGALPQPLQVAVANGDQPVEGALVQFTIVEGTGSLAPIGASDPGPPMTVATGSDGIAAVSWTLEDLTEPNHRVMARLVDRCEEDTHLPVFFSARVGYSVHYLSGDGQEWAPGDDPLAPLRVWVSHGRWPVENATVAFAVVKGTGSVSAPEVQTGPDGVAEVQWTLDTDTHRQQVQAQLLDGPGGSPIHDATIAFNANLSVADHVGFTPEAECEVLTGTTTVKEALDALCARVSYSMKYLSGDGQEGRDGDTLEPLRVWVSDGRFPLENATVNFQVLTGGGTLNPATPVQTDADGIAEVEWILGGAASRQQVEAILVDTPDGEPTHAATIRFNASLSLASRVEYTPASDCATLAGLTTVQDALDELCRSGPQLDPGLHVEEIRVGTGADEGPLENDTDVPADRLAEGITVRCDGMPDPKAVAGKPVVDVVLDLPWPFAPEEIAFFGGDTGAIVGTRPLRLLGEAKADAQAIQWTPPSPTAAWLTQELFTLMRSMKRGSRVLAHLTLRGNFIWAESEPKLYLDGEVFGTASGDGRTILRLDEASGDRRRGGDLEMWFWVTEPVSLPGLVIEVVGTLDRVLGRLTDGEGNAVPAAQVTLTSTATGQTLGALTNATGYFLFPSVEPGSYQIRASVPGFPTAVEEVTVLGPGMIMEPVEPGTLGLVLESVNLIGETTAGNLTDAGVHHPVELLDMTPEEVAERAGVSVDRARLLIQNANRLFS